MIELTLLNGKTIMVGANHIQALITGATGDGALVVLGGTLTYDVRESPAQIADKMRQAGAAV
ncbi:MAG: flagellar FlbD family protein [Pseudomonadota bacterium]